MKNPLLELYSDYLISSFALITATGLSLLLDNEFSHDQITRFLSGADYTSRDLWALAQLYLDDGKRDGLAVVPSDWVRASVTAKAHMQDDIDYGYLWWLVGRTVGGGVPGDWVAALGRNDQKVYVVPSLDLVVTRQGLAANEGGEARTAYDEQLMRAVLDARD